MEPSKQSTHNETLNHVFNNYACHPLHRWWVEPAMACRALFFLGGEFICPCCDWRLRTFTQGGTSLKKRPYGYCPRCNSKARHRRNWLFLQENTNLFSERICLLHVSPKYALSRRFANMPNIQYVGVDIEKRPYVSQLVNITNIPFESNLYDAIICIHVLEHIEQDRKAIRELYRVLKPGGWALITVPINLSRPTYEDPAVVTPDERRKHFGEAQHVRIYGSDFNGRLKEGGFEVHLDRGENIALDKKAKYGLLDDENVFYCTKA